MAATYGLIYTAGICQAIYTTIFVEYTFLNGFQNEYMHIVEFSMTVHPCFQNGGQDGRHRRNIRLFQSFLAKFPNMMPNIIFSRVEGHKVLSTTTNIRQIAPTSCQP